MHALLKSHKKLTGYGTFDTEKRGRAVGIVSAGTPVVRLEQMLIF